MIYQSDVILERLMSLHPKIIDLTLDRMWRLLERLGNPQETLPPVIHIAGTNGKGSTLAMLRAGLEGSGKRVHSYTSPHLVRFQERIGLSGSFIEEEMLAEILAECEAANGAEPITYFEITTCAALLAFSRVPADYLLLEVGLGGRLDATNVIERPDLSIITPISMDHEQYLGHSLAAIASEKAGILKAGCFGLIAPQPEEAMEVISQTAWSVGATLKSHGQEWHVWQERGRLVYQDEYGLLDLPLPKLKGDHQITNAGVATAALRLLGTSEDSAFESALTKVEWPARIQKLASGPLLELSDAHEVWLDGGHNSAAGAALADHFSGFDDQPLILMVGMLETKDAAGFLSPLASVGEALYAVPIKDQSASLETSALAQISEGVGIAAEIAESPEAAMNEVIKRYPKARVLICGSLYLAGSILRDHA